MLLFCGIALKVFKKWELHDESLTFRPEHSQCDNFLHFVCKMSIVKVRFRARNVFKTAQHYALYSRSWKRLLLSQMLQCGMSGNTRSSCSSTSQFQEKFVFCSHSRVNSALRTTDVIFGASATSHNRITTKLGTRAVKEELTLEQSCKDFVGKRLPFLFWLCLIPMVFSRSSKSVAGPRCNV